MCLSYFFILGLPVLDGKREDNDLKVHVQEHCYVGDEDDVDEDEPAGTIFDLLDARAGGWDKDVVNGMYALSCRCLEQNPRSRPLIKEILPSIEALRPQYIEDVGSAISQTP